MKHHYCSRCQRLKLTPGLCAACKKAEAARTNPAAASYVRNYFANYRSA